MRPTIKSPDAAPTPYCLDCHYPLRGLASRRCPECGRPFDPADPATVRYGKPIGWLASRLMRPVGWPTVALAAVALASIAWVTRWPGAWPAFDWIDTREAFRILISRRPLTRWAQLDGPDRAFTLAVGLGAVVMAWWVLREAVAAMTRAIRRPPIHALRRTRPATQLTLIAAALLGSLMLGYGWPYRLARHVAAAVLAPQPKRPPPVTTIPWNLAPFGLNTTQAEAYAALHAGVTRLPSARQRTAALQVLVERWPAEARPILIDAMAREHDPALLATEIRLFGALREPDGPRLPLALNPHLASPDPTIRAAAIDAVGLLYAPPFNLQPWYEEDDGDWTHSQVMNIDPPISLTMLIDRVRQHRTALGGSPTTFDVATPIPLEVLAQLRAALRDAPTQDEREAAARATLRWPPAHYRLRIAEWGVWLNRSNQLQLIESVLADIPPFVHRTGNPIASFAGRVNQMYVTTKPIIHVTADQLMAVDLDVKIRNGRPWFAYPRPDDFSAAAPVRPGWPQVLPRRLPASAPAVPTLAPLDPPPTVGPLDSLRECYPWLTPPAMSAVSAAAGNLNLGPFPVREPRSVGLRYYTLIVSPDRHAWMHPPTVPASPNYAWWSRLRDVPCSWVSSRGESERFLYYDGPTLQPTPLDVNDRDGELELEPGPKLDVMGLYVEVTPRLDGATDVKGADIHVTQYAKFKPIVALQGVELEDHLRAIVRAYGLNEGEAAGLIDCWRKPFFQKPGRRFLTILPTDQYDQLCPLQVRPPPTERARVGILLTELKFDPFLPNGR